MYTRKTFFGGEGLEHRQITAIRPVQFNKPWYTSTVCVSSVAELGSKRPHPEDSDWFQIKSPLMPMVNDVVTFRDPVRKRGRSTLSPIPVVELFYGMNLDFAEKIVAAHGSMESKHERLNHPSEWMEAIRTPGSAGVIYDMFRREFFRLVLLIDDESQDKSLVDKYKDLTGLEHIANNPNLYFRRFVALLANIRRTDEEEDQSSFEEDGALVRFCRASSYLKTGVMIHQYLWTLGVQTKIALNSTSDFSLLKIIDDPMHLLSLSSQDPLLLQFIIRKHLDRSDVASFCQPEFVLFRARSFTVHDRHVYTLVDEMVKCIETSIQNHKFSEKDAKSDVELIVDQVIRAMKNKTTAEIQELWDSVKDELFLVADTCRGRVYYLREYYHMEQVLLENALPFTRHPQLGPSGPMRRLKCQLDDEQWSALERAFQPGLTILTGQPGTGKSHTVAALIAHFLHFTPRPVVVLAFTGRATLVCQRNLKQVQKFLMAHEFAKHNIEVSDLDNNQLVDRLDPYSASSIPLRAQVEMCVRERVVCSTIHRFLHRDPAYDRFEETPILIIDEASMVSLQLCEQLMSHYLSMGNNPHIVLTGDPQQIAPIQPGEVFSAMIHSEKFSRVHLTRIKRAKSLDLIHNIHHFFDPDFRFRWGSSFVRECVPVKWSVDNKPIPIQPTEYASHVLKMLNRYAPNWKEPDQFASFFVTTHTNKTISDLTPFIRAAYLDLDPEEMVQEHKNNSSVRFRIGDRVICTKNTWLDGLLIANGSIGRISAFNENLLPLVVWETGQKTPMNEEKLELSYSSTVHKVQGSQAPLVIFVVTNNMLEKRIAYTAISRAQEQVVIVAPKGRELKFYDEDPRRFMLSDLFNGGHSIPEETEP